MSQEKIDWVDKYQKWCCQNVTAIKIKNKEDSRLMRLIGKLMFFNPSFMTNFITTIGKTIYLPKGFSKEFTNIEVLAHETQHIVDSKKIPLLYGVAYLFPQILILLSLLSLGAIWGSKLWLLNLLWLLCALPIPAPFRMLIERRGYMMSAAVNYWLWGNDHYELYLNYFTGPAYYFMWPFKKHLSLWFHQMMTDLRFEIFPTKLMPKVKQFIDEEVRNEISRYSPVPKK